MSSSSTPSPSSDSNINDESPIFALAPKAARHEESQAEISASPAFECLDELFNQGILTGTKVAQLKAKYMKIHEALKRKRDHESQLLQEAKTFTNELEKQAIELEKAESFPEGYNSEAAKLRQQLLSHHNELAQIEERQYQLQYKIECFEEEKRLIEREYSRIPKTGEAEKIIENIKTSTNELKKEIGQRQNDCKNLKEDLNNTNRLVQLELKEVETAHEELEKLKSDLIVVNTQPVQIAKEGDRMTRQKNDLEKKQKTLNLHLKELMENLQKLQSKQQKLEDDKFELLHDVERRSAVLQSKEREYDDLCKQFEYAKEQEAVLLGDRATLDMNLRHINLDKKTTHEIHSRKVREKDRDIRNLKKCELQLKVAEDAIAHYQQIYEKSKAMLDSQPKDDGSMQLKRTELQREVEQTKRALAQQNSLTAVENVKVEQSIAEEERLLYEQSDLRIEVVELTRLATIKNDEREQKARDFMKAEQRYHRAVQDLRTKHLQIQDNQKKAQEMQIKLKDFAKKYDIIKNERNKCVNLIQTSTQKVAEMREKIKILLNEIEILRTAVTQKDKFLQKQRLKHVNAIVIRDSQRNEVAKQQRHQEKMRQQSEQQEMDIRKLNVLINKTEQEMIELRKRFAQSVQYRNDRGIQLIERNEETCIFHEKRNIQESMIRSGDVEMQSLEEEIRFLKLQLTEEKRSIDLLKKTMPEKKSLEKEITNLQIQISRCQDQILKLEEKIETPSNDESRIRFLSGKDFDPTTLQKKLEELEVRLAKKEESLLEKDLIFEQVCRLVERTNKKSDAGKNDTLNLAKKVNEFQARIKDVTRRMMAIVSELSMRQAEALHLQQETRMKEAQLEQNYLRLEKGEPPSDDLEQEWNKLIARKNVKENELRMAKLNADEEEQYMLPGGVTTTADPRPNAYIPNEEATLPIPRPYGAHAPFKPSEPGSTMRHIRKPVSKPIEI